jgi:site-specific recombinase XerD
MTQDFNPNTLAHISENSLLVPTIKAWRFYLEDQVNSIHTIKAFIADLNLFSNYMAPDRTLGSIATTDLNMFLEWMEKRRGVPCSPKTLARRITSIKAFFRWLHQNAVIIIDPAEKVLQRSVISPLAEILTQSEITKVLKIAEAKQKAVKPDTRYLTLFKLLITTGIKKGECLSLTLNHFDLETPEGSLLFIRYASPQNRYKERKIMLDPSWIPIYESYLAQYQINERVFPWSQRRLEYLLEDLSRDAGLNKHLSFDMCRWTCALNDWRSGMDRNALRQKLGISKIQWREVSMKLEKLAFEA